MRRFLRIENIEFVKPFDCGDSILNGFVMDDARFFYDEFIANTFVLEDEEETIAYFSLLNDKISNTIIPKNIWRKLRNHIPHEKHFSSYPAIKIGRLAVSKNHQGEHLGSILLDTIKSMLAKRASVGACRFITVDALIGRQSFYEKNGFRLLQNDVPADSDTVLMYYDLKSFAE
ncbi:MAG: GNAT family N-acetyltransferase [Prevotella sp.]|nr:GNAT family N-acetyltransferase [Prevotella sp.]